MNRKFEVAYYVLKPLEQVNIMLSIYWKLRTLYRAHKSHMKLCGTNRLCAGIETIAVRA